jgi:lipopolysaccharide/colanic/teichoic acid biosynthesis glycosyltransferase
MRFANFVFALRRLLRRNTVEWSEVPHSPHQTRFILERERSRADRSGDPLSVISFAPRCPQESKTCLQFLIKSCKERLRGTDEIGWLDAQSICAILPGTGEEGARKVVDDICLGFPDQITPPLCTVHAFVGGPGEGNVSAEETLASNRNGFPLSGPPGGDGMHECRSRPLEDLFVQSVPLWKRTLDLTGAIAGLVLLSPVMGAVTVAVKLSSRGPVFFSQWRSGRGRKPFLMYKFRTMVADAEEKKDSLRHLNERDGPAFKIQRDPRVTAVGRFLRTTSLDELPQLWNVLMGEMSLVGPRPLPCDETAAASRWQHRRLDVNPGLTCIWQIKGRSGVPFAEWIRMDMQYIRSMSLLQDLKLLVLTVPSVLLRGGAH